MCVVGKTKVLYSGCVGLLSLLVWGLAGMAVATLPSVLIQNINSMDPTRCGLRQIDDANPYSFVPESCLPVVGARHFADLTGRGARVAIFSPYASVIRYSFESLNFLTKNIMARDEMAWARFELSVSFLYTLVSCVLLLFVTTFIPQICATVSELYGQVGARATADVAQHGTNFPLALNTSLPEQTQAALDIFYIDPSVGRTLAIILIAVQIAGLVVGNVFSGNGSEIKTIRGLRVVVIVKAILLLGTWPFITYIALYQVNATNNLLLFITMGSLTQFYFGCNFAVNTDILPFFKDLGGKPPIIVVTRFLSVIIPIFLLGGGSVLSAVLWTASDQATISAASTAFAIITALTVVFVFIFAILSARAFMFHSSSMGQFFSEKLSKYAEKMGVKSPDVEAAKEGANSKVQFASIELEDAAVRE